MKGFILTILMAVTVNAQGVTCRNLASGDGIVAPQTIVLCTGVPIEREVFSKHPANPETELDGVSLSVNGQLAGLRGIGPDGITAILPDFNVGWRFRTSAWINTPNGSYLVRLPSNSTSPAMFSNFGERPQGYAWSPTRQLWVIEQGPIPAQSTVNLICTGTRLASEVYVLLGGERIAAVSAPFPGFKGLEYVTFELPAGVAGNLSLQIVADGRASNALSILIE